MPDTNTEASEDDIPAILRERDDIDGGALSALHDENVIRC